MKTKNVIKDMEKTKTGGHEKYKIKHKNNNK